MTPGLLLSAMVVLALIHFGVPLSYYYYLKKWLGKPWNMRRDPWYKPKVSIMVLTYNQAKLVEEKLDDIYEQNTANISVC